MSHRSFLFVAIASAILVGVACGPNPKVPDNPDRRDGGPLEGDGGVCSMACLHLREWSCSEGRAPTCENTCATAVGVVLPAGWPECVLRANVRTDLLVCNVRCRP